MREVDVADILKAERQAYDAVLLDVDNGPAGLTRKGNDWLYARAGLHAVFAALRPAGVLAVWSASTDRAFTQRLRDAGFEVDEVPVRCALPAGERGTRFGLPSGVAHHHRGRLCQAAVLAGVNILPIC